MESNKPYRKVLTAQAPVNIAVIKYWGKSNATLKLPINDSISGTLNCNELCTTTSIYISDQYEKDELVLNGNREHLGDTSPAKIMLDEIRQLSPNVDGIVSCKTHMISENNFPTAAGLASSAAGYACLAFALGHAYGITDLSTLSTIARKGSGSACRSIFGGFVQWEKGVDHKTSLAKQIVDHTHWPEMRVIILVVDDVKKDVSSSSGMAQSVRTSSLIKHRADNIVPARINAITKAILDKNFEEFAHITMQDSNQFHAVCLDTFPPLFYLNDTSKHIIRICSLLNTHYGRNKVAYTFDAGPNACIYLLDDFVGTFMEIIKHYFALDGPLKIKGSYNESIGDRGDVDELINFLNSKNIDTRKDAISYVITTTIGDGPKLIEEHLQESSKFQDLDDHTIV